jgi:hypothetical protein
LVAAERPEEEATALAGTAGSALAPVMATVPLIVGRGQCGSEPSPRRVPGVNAAVRRPWYGASAGDTLETGGPPGLVRPARRGHEPPRGAREGETSRGLGMWGGLGKARAASGGAGADA